MNIRLLAGLAALILLVPILAYLTGAIFIVPETHSAVITRFGEVQRVVVSGFYEAPGGVVAGRDDEDPAIDEKQIDYVRSQYPDTHPIAVDEGAGWYLKVPFVDNVHYFDARLLDWDGEKKEVATRDLRTLLVDSASRWRILDPVRFYEAIGPSSRFAQDRMDGVLISTLEDHIAETRLIEAVRNQDLKLDERVEEMLQAVGEEEVEADKIRYGRMDMIRSIEEEAGRQLRDQFGIQLVDLMITQLNYTESVRKQVYDRMNAERERIARRYRAQGERTKRRILGEVQRREDEILSNARRQREQILGQAERRRIEIVARAHKKDPDFYRFWRSLQAYDQGFDTGTSLILTDDNPLLEYTTQPLE